MASHPYASQHRLLFAWAWAAAMLAISIPDSILTDYPALKSYVDAIAQVMPSINHLAAVSSFPEVTRSVLAVLWTAVPVQIVIGLVKPGTVNPPNDFLLDRMYEYKWRSMTFALLLTPIMLLMVVFLPVQGSDLDGKMVSERILRLASKSKMWFGVISGAVCFCTAMCICISATWMRYLPAIYFNVKSRRN